MNYEKDTRTKKKRREHIVEIAKHLFHERGIEGTTMNDIAAEAKIGRSTFYEYFNSKSELVTYIRALYLKEMYTQPIKLEPKDTGKEQLRLVFKTYFQAMLDQPKIILFLMEFIRYFKIQGESEVALTLPEENTYMELQHAIEKGKLDGSLNPNDVEKNVTIIMESLIGSATRFAVREHYTYHGRENGVSNSEMIHLVDIMIDGITL